MTPAYAEGDLVIFRPLRQDEKIPDGSAVFVRFGSLRQHACHIQIAVPQNRRPTGHSAPKTPAQRVIAAGDEIERMALAIRTPKPVSGNGLGRSAWCGMNTRRSFRRKCKNQSR